MQIHFAQHQQQQQQQQPHTHEQPGLRPSRHAESAVQMMDPSAAAAGGGGGSGVHPDYYSGGQTGNSTMNLTDGGSNRPTGPSYQQPAAPMGAAMNKSNEPGLLSMGGTTDSGAGHGAAGGGGNAISTGNATSNYGNASVQITPGTPHTIRYLPTAAPTHQDACGPPRGPPAQRVTGQYGLSDPGLGPFSDGMPHAVDGYSGRPNAFHATTGSMYSGGANPQAPMMMHRIPPPPQQQQSYPQPPQMPQSIHMNKSMLSAYPSGRPNGSHSSMNDGVWLPGGDQQFENESNPMGMSSFPPDMGRFTFFSASVFLTFLLTTHQCCTTP